MADGGDGGGGRVEDEEGKVHTRSPIMRLPKELRDSVFKYLIPYRRRIYRDGPRRPLIARVSLEGNWMRRASGRAASAMRVTWKDDEFRGLHTALFATCKQIQEETQSRMYEAVAFHTVVGVSNPLVIGGGVGHPWLAAPSAKLRTTPIRWMKSVHIQIESGRTLSFRRWLEDRRRHGPDCAFLQSLAPNAELRITLARQDSSQPYGRKRGANRKARQPSDGSVRDVLSFVAMNLRTDVRLILTDELVTPRLRGQARETISKGLLSIVYSSIERRGLRAARIGNRRGLRRAVDCI